MALCPLDVGSYMPLWYYSSGLCCYRIFTSEVTSSIIATATAITCNKRGGGGGSHLQSKELVASET
jgi:hypothetical protein